MLREVWGQMGYKHNKILASFQELPVDEPNTNFNKNWTATPALASNIAHTIETKIYIRY